MSKRSNVALWTIQAILAAVFLFAGAMKFILPIAEMTKQMPLPGAFIRFIGVCEIAGALGLVLPGLFRIRPELTPLAARGLVIIMSGATALSLLSGVTAALLPIVVGLLAVVVAFGRGRDTAWGAAGAPNDGGESPSTSAPRTLRREVASRTLNLTM
jgi:DoxX-like protein